MNTSVKYLKRRYHNRNISKVYIWFCSKDTNRLYRKNQIVMHRSLSHNFFYDHNFFLTRSSHLFKCFCINNKCIIQFLQGKADLLCDHIRCSVGRKRSRTFHIRTFFDDHFCLNEDFTFLRRSRSSPHNIFI